MYGDRMTTDILLLFVDVSNLKPDVDFGERSRRILQNISETLQLERSVLRATESSREEYALQEIELICAVACR